MQKVINKRLSFFRRSIFYLVGMSFIAASVSARPFLKIQQIRTYDYPSVRAEVSVSKILPILNLDERNFTLRENNWLVKSFSVKQTNPDQDPKNVVLVFDASRSVNKKAFQRQKAAARDFAKKMDVKDHLAVISFQDKVKIHCHFTSLLPKKNSCIDEIKRDGKKTKLYDALLEAMTMFDLSSSLSQRNSIIVFTDGKDEGSIIKLDDLLRRSENTRVPIFLAGSGRKKEFRNIIRLSKVSGGEAFHTVKHSKIDRVIRMISVLIDSTYQIEYISQAANTSDDGKSVELEIELNIPPGKAFEKGILDRDQYIYILPPSLRGGFTKAWWLRFVEDPRYVAFFLGIVILLLAFSVLALALLRRKDTRKDDPSEITSSALEDNIANNTFDIKIQPTGPYGGIDSAQVYKTQKQNTQAQNEKKSQAIESNRGSISDYVPHDFELRKKFRTGVAVSTEETKDFYNAYLLEKEGPHTGKRYPIHWHTVTIGHSEENSIVLSDPSVSFVHAKIVRTREGFVIYDLLSETSVWLNGKKLLRPRILNDFDEIILGRTRLIFRRVSGETIRHLPQK